MNGEKGKVNKSYRQLISIHVVCNPQPEIHVELFILDVEYALTGNFFFFAIFAYPVFLDEKFEIMFLIRYFGSVSIKWFQHQE